MGPPDNRGRTSRLSGEYRDIVPGKRLVHTELFEIPGLTEADATLNTLVFEDHDGRTTLTATTDCPSPEILDSMIASGMEGWHAGRLRPARGARDLAGLIAAAP